MRSYRLLLVVVAACGGKSADPLVVAPASSIAPHGSITEKPIVSTVPPSTPSTTAFRCPSETVRKAVLDCPASASGPAPQYLDVLDAMSRENDDQMRSRRKPPKPKDFTAQALSPLQQKLVDVSKAYRCFGKGDRSQMDEAAYELGRTYFETHHWEEAAAIFHVVAMERSDVSEYAAQLALESINVLASELHRADCNEELGPRVTLYRQHLCGSPPIANNETCTTLTKIEAEVAAKKKP